MSEPLDRRAFLALLGGGSAAVLAGCGTATGQASSSSSSTGLSASERATFTTGERIVGATGPTAPRGAAAATPRSLAAAIRGPVIRPGNPAYAAASQLYNERFDSIRPALVARPLDAADVRDAIRYTVARGMPLRARSGGHSYAGYSKVAGGVMLDLRELNHISVDRRAGTATIGAGCQLIDVYSKLAAQGATLPGGSCPSVGISGVTLGGGMGLAGRAFGLTLDNLVALQVVTADGALRTVSAKADPDLFWALRGGGGGNFGVVTSFTFKVHPLPRNAVYFNVSWPWSSAAEAVDAWQRWVAHAPDSVTSILHLNSGSSPTITANGQFVTPPASLAAALAPLTAVSGGLITSSGTLTASGMPPYVALQQYWAGCSGHSLVSCHTEGAAAGGTLPRNSFNAKSDYVAKPLSSAGCQAMVAATESFGGGGGALLCDSYGGAINRVAPDATAFVHRDQLFCIQYYGNGPSTVGITAAWRKLRPYVSGEAYQNYIDPALIGWQKAYYGTNLKRLQQIRAQIDPHHYFHFPQAI